jgi:hypothetical protein
MKCSAPLLDGATFTTQNRTNIQNVWKIKVSPGVSIFTWLMMKNAILTVRVADRKYLLDVFLSRRNNQSLVFRMYDHKRN